MTMPSLSFVMTSYSLVQYIQSPDIKSLYADRSLAGCLVDTFPHLLPFFKECIEGVSLHSLSSHCLGCLSTMKPSPQWTHAPMTKETNKVVCQLAVTDHSSSSSQPHRQGRRAPIHPRLETSYSLQEETRAWKPLKLLRCSTLSMDRLDRDR